MSHYIIIINWISKNKPSIIMKSRGGQIDTLILVQVFFFYLRNKNFILNEKNKINKLNQIKLLSLGLMKILN